MKNYQYIEDFKKLGFGMFVHFGISSQTGEGIMAGGWNFEKKEDYCDLIKTFRVREDWAKELVKTAKDAGCKYITFTTRHHDGFSHFDTSELEDDGFDSLHSPTARDTLKELVDECNAQGIVPFFYLSLISWFKEKQYLDSIGQKTIYNRKTEYAKWLRESGYIEYLIKTIELLCTKYGKIGGMWFDGSWVNNEFEWPFDRIYGTVRKLQPTAMIIDNTGIDACGVVGHPEIDAVTFERGKPGKTVCTDRPRAGEMCETLNSHWGYALNDVTYKTPEKLIEELLDCRSVECNMLLNVGPQADGSLRTIDKGTFEIIGQWLKANKYFIYDVKPADIQIDGETVLMDSEGNYYVVVKNVPIRMIANLQRRQGEIRKITVPAQVESAEWLDNGEQIPVENNAFYTKFFDAGFALGHRIAKLRIKK